MRFEELYIAGLGTWLPPAVEVRHAVADGECTEELARKNGMEAVTVARDDEVPAEMAVKAACTALRRAGDADGARYALGLHAALYHQGHELWGSASYIQRHTTGGSHPVLEVRQVSNGGMAALGLAGGYLTATADGSRALITTADRFCPPGFDRWHTDPGTVYADGGTALVLSTHGGFARIRSLALVSDAELEGMHRAGDPFATAGFAPAGVLDLESYKRGFLAVAGMSFSVSRIAAGQRRALGQALDEAGVKLQAVNRFVLPHFGQRRLQANYLRHLDVGLDATNWSFSKRVGHLGAGDQIASLDHLTSSGVLQAGDVVLLLGVGAGFTWSCAVVEILDTPDWASSSRS